MTSIQLKEVLDKAAYLKLWIKEVETYAEKRLNEGLKIEGWGLKAKRAQRVWKDASEVKESLWGEMYLTTSELISPAQAEKVLRSNKLDGEAIEKFLKANVVAISSGTTLAQHDDYAERDLESLFGEL